MGQVTGLHVQDGHAGGIATKVDGGYGAAGGRVDGDCQRAKAYFVLLIAESVTAAANISQDEAELVDGGDGAGGEGNEVDTREVLLELVGGQPGEQNASHAGAIGR